MANGYDPAIILAEVYAWLAEGKTLRAYCRQPDKPHYSTIYNWLEADAKSADTPETVRFQQARDMGEQQILQECLEIADTPRIGEIVTQKGDGTMEIKSADMIEHRKLQIETRLKLLAKWNPKKYGDKLALEGEIGIRTVLVPKPVKDSAPRPATMPDFEA